MSLFYFWALVLSFGWLVMVFLPSFPAVRNLMAVPLVIHDQEARGDAAYLLAGGNAFRERLAAAADLYHMGRVPQIIFMQDSRRSSYNFVEGRNWTPTEWAVSFLQWRGVPAEAVHLLKPAEPGALGTRAEARLVASTLTADVKRLVLVTSAAHTRRTLMTFRRILPPRVVLTSYAATAFTSSLEMHLPLWLEYVKLLVYSVTIPTHV